MLYFHCWQLPTNTDCRTMRRYMIINNNKKEEFFTKPWSLPESLQKVLDRWHLMVPEDEQSHGDGVSRGGLKWQY